MDVLAPSRNSTVTLEDYANLDLEATELYTKVIKTIRDSATSSRKIIQPRRGTSNTSVESRPAQPAAVNPNHIGNSAEDQPNSSNHQFPSLTPESHGPVQQLLMQIYSKDSNNDQDNKTASISRLLKMTCTILTEYLNQ